MGFIIPPSEPPQPCAVRTDPAKRALLKDKLAALLAPIGTTKQAVTDGGRLDIDEVAKAVRAGLPAGLARDDFDGTDLEAIVAELLGV